MEFLMKFHRSLPAALALCAICDPGMAAAQSSPSHRTRAAMAYDSHRDVIVPFGGITDAGLSDETWEWDGTSWLQRTPSSAPTPRGDTDLAYDRVRGVTILFGGGGQVDDTWEWDGQDWTQRFPLELARRAPDAQPHL